MSTTGSGPVAFNQTVVGTLPSNYREAKVVEAENPTIGPQSAFFIHGGVEYGAARPDR